MGWNARGLAIVASSGLAVVVVARVQTAYVLEVDPGPVGYVIPLLVGTSFGYLLARVLHLRGQLKEALRDSEASAAQVVMLNEELAHRFEEQSHQLDATASHLRQAQKLDALGRLAGGVAHDFNNLLTVILSGATLLSEVTDEDRKRAIVDDMLQAARRGADLTQQLLTFGRPQLEAPKLHDLGQLVEDMLPMLRRLLGKEVEIDWRREGNLPPVLVDAGQIGQVVMNLAVNARDAMPDGGTIELSGQVRRRRGSQWVCLVVKDSGVGMDDRTLRQALDPFYSTKAPGKGTGLGLSVAYGIVRSCRGHLDMSSEPGVGTEVTIELPVAEGPPSLTTARRPQSNTTEDATGVVLVVDDDQQVRDMVRRALTSRGYTVLSASDGAGALEVARAATQPIALVLCDVRLNGEHGPEVARRVLEHAREAALVFTSGHTEVRVEDLGMTSEPLMEKPFEVAELARRTAEAIRGRRGGKQHAG